MIAEIGRLDPQSPHFPEDISDSIQQITQAVNGFLGEDNMSPALVTGIRGVTGGKLADDYHLHQQLVSADGNPCAIINLDGKLALKSITEAGFLKADANGVVTGGHSSGTLTDTYVGYGDTDDTLTGEAAFTYNASTNTMTVDNVLVANGSAASCSIAFQSDTNAGMFWTSGYYWSLVMDGSRYIDLYDGGEDGYSRFNKRTIHNTTGNGTQPALSFLNGGIEGGLHTAGTGWSGTYGAFHMVVGAFNMASFVKNTTDCQIFMTGGSNIRPNYSWPTDTDTGMFLYNTGILGLAAAGVDIVRVDGDGMYMPYDNMHLKFGASGNGRINNDGTDMTYEAQYVSGAGIHKFLNDVNLYISGENPILKITARHDTDYDPQIQFETDEPGASVKFSMGVDGTDDHFIIDNDTDVSGASPAIDIHPTSGTIGFGQAAATTVALDMRRTFTAASYTYGVYGAITFNPVSNSSSDFWGMQYFADKKGSYNIRDVYTVEGFCGLNGGGNVRNVQNFSSRIYSNNMTGQITGNATFFYAKTLLTGTATVVSGEVIGLELEDPTSALNASGTYRGIIVNSGWDVALSALADNLPVTFGAGEDCKIEFDGTDMITDYDALNSGTTDYRIQENGTDRFVILTGGVTQLLGDTQVAAGKDLDCYTNAAYFKPRRVSQSTIPTPDANELMVWRDSDDSKTYLVYNDANEGVRSVEMI